MFAPDSRAQPSAHATLAHTGYQLWAVFTRLSYGHVRSCHKNLEAHWYCDTQRTLAEMSHLTAWDDYKPCDCQVLGTPTRQMLPWWRDDVQVWPGSICCSCWAASCTCGFVFESEDDAHGNWPSGRLRCAGCAPRE